MATKRVPDDVLIASYKRLGNVHKVGAEVGLTGGSVHERLVRLGVAKKLNVFTDEERKRLEQEYVIYRDSGRLRELAADMGRTVPFLSRQARTLGLTDNAAPRPTIRVWKGMSESTASVIWEDFKKSSLGLGAYCRSKGYDDLGFARTMREHFGDEWDHVIELKVPKQTKYRLGRAFEYQIRDRLKPMGYWVLRSPASRSPVDLVAIAPGVVLLVQCKRGGALPPSEWNELFDLAASIGAWPIMAERVGAKDVCYWLLTDRKDGSRRRQPMRETDPRDYLTRTEEAAA